jgi:hypothetical protein
LKVFKGGTFSPELGAFRGVEEEELEPDVLDPEGVDTSSISPACSKRLSNDSPTFFPTFIAAKNGLSLDDGVDDDPDEIELEYGMVKSCFAVSIAWNLEAMND